MNLAHVLEHVALLFKAMGAAIHKALILTFGRVRSNSIWVAIAREDVAFHIHSAGMRLLAKHTSIRFVIPLCFAVVLVHVLFQTVLTGVAQGAVGALGARHLMGLCV